MVEPFASDRLRLVLGSPALSSSHSDTSLTAAPSAGHRRHAPAPHPDAAVAGTIPAAADRESPLLAALEPPAVPSAPLAEAIARCADCRPDALCAAHQAAWREERWRGELARHAHGERFADGYAEFRDQAFASTRVASSCLALLRTQAEALALVWEAHARGAVALPAPVLAAVLAARRKARERG